ncbi:polysaccharide deacetylase family protein [Tautonia plasticadhaerens]|uniref:Methionyl-tRNA formyltransferase n=1 Tax=Tautonia plasticadhaerens TaxID=2527974 RepID=A0A518HFU8_9BACT|nr:polysaccharide deacetylase family protein [Tautonia plasticadhaerens]QDV39731.1 Methionyl-tRNA formyltransferase [Tautonia plasticadhaerens]
MNTREPAPDGRRLRVLILTGTEPLIVARLIERIGRQPHEAAVCGVLYHRLPDKSKGERVREVIRNLGRPAYFAHFARRVGDSVSAAITSLGRFLLRCLHAHFPQAGEGSYGLADLVAECRGRGRPIRVVEDIHADSTLEFVRSLGPDLAIVYGTPILKPCLYEIPQFGSINLHQRKVPDYRGGGPIGLWELLDDQPDIGVTVHRVVRRLDAGAVLKSATIPIEPYDDLTSLALKAHVVGIELLADVVADFARGRVSEAEQSGASRMFRTPDPAELRRHLRRIAVERGTYRPPRGRPIAKLVLKSLVYLPLVLARNWYRRSTGRFPVVVLYHHLLADRPHFMGIPTSLYARHVAFLRRYYRVVGLQEALAMLESGRVDAPTVVLTFDDGYRDNVLRLRAASLASPAPAMLFVCSRHLDQGEPFDHDLAADALGFEPMSWDEARELEHWGFSFGSHTRTHLDCGTTDTERLQPEIIGSRSDIEGKLGHPIEYFSYPKGLPGNISPQSIDICRSHYKWTCSAYGGVNTIDHADASWHVYRMPHPNDLLELELQIQQVLEQRPGHRLDAPDTASDVYVRGAT